MKKKIEVKEMSMFDMLYTRIGLYIDVLIILLAFVGMIIVQLMQGHLMNTSLIVDCFWMIIFMCWPLRIARMLQYKFSFIIQLGVFLEYVYFNKRVFGALPNGSIFLLIFTGLSFIIRIIQTARVYRKYTLPYWYQWSGNIFLPFIHGFDVFFPLDKQSIRICCIIIVYVKGEFYV